MKWNPEMTPSFSVTEMRCKCGCGEAPMDGDFMAKLQALRDRVGPLQVNSGYRCPDHPVEAKKQTPGAHAHGLAADIKPLKVGIYEATKEAFDIGFVGIGIENGWLHVDSGHPHKHRPAMWTY